MRFIYNLRNRKKIKDFTITQQDIKNAKKVLFVIFGRYGDSVIGFNASLEFIEKYPNKEYLFITSYQNYPYFVDKCKKYKNCKVIKFHKSNIFKLLFLIMKIRKFDLGFNSYSWGNESEFLISFTKKFSFFYNIKLNILDNYYNKARKYLLLPKQEIVLNEVKLDNVKNILICPESSEKRRSLMQNHLDYLLDKYKNFNIIVAHSNKYKTNTKEFIFSKKNSPEFLNLLKESDLIISVDSAPLHLAMLYNKKIYAIFSSSVPMNVVKSGDIKIFRNNKLKNIMCEKKDCNKPFCIDLENEYNLIEKNIQIVKDCVVEERE